MKKKDRQALLKQLLASQPILRQEDFVALLNERGIAVTQATISRDVKEMQLVKVPTSDGQYRYSLPKERRANAEQKLKKLLNDAYVYSDIADKQVVLKVLPGNGPAVKEMIDSMDYAGLFAVIGDDNTIMIFTRSADDAVEIHGKLLKLINRTY